MAYATNKLIIRCNHTNYQIGCPECMKRVWAQVQDEQALLEQKIKSLPREDRELIEYAHQGGDRQPISLEDERRLEAWHGC